MDELASAVVPLPPRTVQVGHKKLAAGAIGSVTLTPLILWLWSLFDTYAVPNADLSMPDMVAGHIGALLAALFFQQTTEQIAINLPRPVAKVD